MHSNTFVRGSAQTLHPHSEYTHPSSGSLKKIATEAVVHTPTIPVTSVQPLDPSFPVASKAPPDSFAVNSAGQRQTDIFDSASEMAVVSFDLPASHDKMRNQQIPEGSPQVPSERQFNPSANDIRHPSSSLVPTFAWPVSPLDQPLADSTGVPQITVGPSVPVDLSVFNWNSIPNPLVETAVSTSTCRLPSLMYNGSSCLGSNRPTRVTLCPKLRPRSVELRASRSPISGTTRRTWIQPSLSIG